MFLLVYFCLFFFSLFSFYLVRTFICLHTGLTLQGSDWHFAPDSETKKERKKRDLLDRSEDTIKTKERFVQNALQ
jgi:hypothetical protein